MTYNYERLPPEKLRQYQKSSQEVIQMKHLARCKDAAILYEKYGDINLVAEKLGVKVRQAFRLVAKGKTL